MYNPLERLVNKKKWEEEKKEKERLEEEEKQRSEYFDSLRNNPLFRKYVIDEIIVKRLDTLNSILNVQESENMQEDVRIRKSLYLTLKEMFIRLL